MLNTSLYTMFRVFLVGVYMYRLFLLPTLEAPTYNCPCEKHGSSNCSPATFRDWPCDLLIDIAKDSRTGNWSLLNWNGMSDGIIGIRGMNTFSPVPLPVIIVASIQLIINFFTTNLVPLHNLGGNKFLNSIIGVPIFNWKNIYLSVSLFVCSLWNPSVPPLGCMYEVEITITVLYFFAPKLDVNCNLIPQT